MTSPTADLAGSTLLASLSPEELRAAAQLFSVRRFPKDAILVTEGDRLDVFSIILSGKVKGIGARTPSRTWCRIPGSRSSS